MPPNSSERSRVQITSDDSAVAPDNAIEPVKQLVRRQSGYVSHQPWGHGVARGLEHYLSKAGFQLWEGGEKS